MFLDIRQITGGPIKISRLILLKMHYDQVMTGQDRAQKWLPLTALLLAGTLFFVVVFLGWMQHGADIFLTLVETGLAYCF
ncbi:hypothetical protein H6M51_18445 [Rhizobium sp. AQ_MP]|uniref:hypothetical protein n=1 Tax=Rhizobium sp. AQ_MP TaxID=2761536 RepID=UPI00163AD89F|nr:hypothetical protein [Rhizobium sp. AQ_MP]MBC2774844.1 hypothetical protein [Rhizobium sp. AQ_MP]